MIEGRKIRVISGDDNNPKVVAIVCPGCNEEHQIWVANDHPNGARWSFNGDFNNPTFKPSLLVRSGHYIPEHKSDSCWCTWNEEHKDDPAPFKCKQCHSYITDGKIQFLGDCTHALAGQTVDLPFNTLANEEE
jgi:hypothetical protein